MAAQQEDPFGYSISASDEQRIFVVLSDAQATFRGDEFTNRQAVVSFEELRDRAVYVLTGESGANLLTEDGILPDIQPAVDGTLGGLYGEIGSQARDIQEATQSLIDSDTWTLQPRTTSGG